MPSRTILTLAPAVALAATWAAGCVDKNPASDVSGNYEVTYDNVIELTLKVGGAVHQTTVTSATATATWQGAGDGGEPITLDLGAFCDRAEVQCPSENFWTQVAVHQPNIDSRVSNSHVLNVIDNRVRDLPAGQQAQVVAGWVDAKDAFVLGLGAGARGGGQAGVGGCALLALSVAGGRFSHEGETVETPAPDAGLSPEAGVPTAAASWAEGAPVDGIKDGKIKTGFLGGCAFGPILVGASLEIVTGFTATRTGDFDPPPYTPLDPEEVAPGIVDGGGFDFGQLDSAAAAEQ